MIAGRVACQRRQPGTMHGAARKQSAGNGGEYGGGGRTPRLQPAPSGYPRDRLRAESRFDALQKFRTRRKGGVYNLTVEALLFEREFLRMSTSPITPHSVYSASGACAA